MATPDLNVDRRLLVVHPLQDHIHDMLRRARAEETCFVSFGEMDAAGVASRSDPPLEYLRSLQKSRQNTMPGSAGEFRDHVFCDRTNGRTGVLISIDFDWTKGPNEVVVSLGFHRNGLDGFGESVRVVKEGNVWVVKEQLSHWIS